MAEARITGAGENPLCTRLKAKFDGRGLSKAEENAKTGTFQRIRKESPVYTKAKSVANPFEDTARFVRSEGRVKNQASAQTATFARPVAHEQSAKGRVAAREVSTPFASGAYAGAYARAQKIRERAYDGREARESAVRMA